MKRLAVLIGIASLALVLGGCGLVPPVPVNNPLQLDGAELAVTVPGSSPASISPLAVTATGTTGSLPFDDWNLNLPLNPRSLTVNGGFQRAVTVVPSDGTDCPATLTISNIALTVRIWDGATTFDSASSSRRVSSEASHSGSLTMTSNPGFPCRYTFDPADLLAGRLKVELSGATLGRVLDIVQNTPQTNYVEAMITMAVSGIPTDPSAGTVIRFTLDMAEGEVRVF